MCGTGRVKAFKRTNAAIGLGLLTFLLVLLIGCEGDSRYKMMEDEATGFRKLNLFLSPIKNADHARKAEVEEIAKDLAELHVRGEKFPESGVNEEGREEVYDYRYEAIVVFGKKLSDWEMAAVLKVEFESMMESFRE